MSIAHQSATPRPTPRARQWRQLRPALAPQPVRSVAKISALIGLTALGAALASAAVGLGLVMLMAKLAG